jgi:hypothetical protein
MSVTGPSLYLAFEGSVPAVPAMTVLRVSAGRGAENAG